MSIEEDLNKRRVPEFHRSDTTNRSVADLARKKTELSQSEITLFAAELSKKGAVPEDLLYGGEQKKLQNLVRNGYIKVLRNKTELNPNVFVSRQSSDSYFLTDKGREAINKAIPVEQLSVPEEMSTNHAKTGDMDPAHIQALAEDGQKGIVPENNEGVQNARLRLENLLKA